MTTPLFDEAKVKQFAINKTKIKELEEVNEALIQELGLRTAPIGTTVVGNLVVEVSRNARFDAELAAELYPLTDENQKLYKVVVDATLAKKHLTPAQYEQTQKVYPNNKVEIKLK